MAERIPQSVSYLVVFRAFLASDGRTPATGKTIAITISKNGATSFSNPNAGATNATEMASGFYKFTLDTTDTGTLGPLAWRGAEGTINDAGDVKTVSKATNAGFSALPDAAAEAAGGLYTRGSGAGQINQNANGQVDTRTVSMLDAVMTAAKFASGAFDAVWTVTTRLLTAGTNIVLAKGTGVTGFNDIAAGAAMTLTSGERDSIADAKFDRANGIETGLTERGGFRLLVAAAAGKASGLATSTVVYRNAVADSKARITATVDADGNRSAVTTDMT